MKIESFHILDKMTIAYTLKTLFQTEGLWEKRDQRKVNYRSGEWYTIGAPLYLDLLSKEGYGDYLTKVAYFNQVLKMQFGFFLEIFQKHAFEGKSKFLSDRYPQISLPGFHIFSPHDSAGFFFGKKHRDLQWEVFNQLPGFPFDTDEIKNHFSFTLVLKSPFMGSGLLSFEGDTINEHQYTECLMYVHDGQSEHAIGPFKNPVLPCDWRITFQGHGFEFDKQLYLYW